MKKMMTIAALVIGLVICVCGIVTKGNDSKVAVVRAYDETTGETLALSYTEDGYTYILTGDVEAMEAAYSALK